MLLDEEICEPAWSWEPIGAMVRAADLDLGRLWILVPCPPLMYGSFLQDSTLKSSTKKPSMRLTWRINRKPLFIKLIKSALT